MMGTIRLSKSSIESYLGCSKRYYYRINFPEEAKKTPQMALGNAIHSILEKYWHNEKEALASIEQYLKLYGLYSNEFYQKAQKQIINYFGNFTSLVKNNDLIEYGFSVPYSEDVFIVGKFDRVNLEENYIIDWKTGNSSHGGDSNDIQSIIYYNSYKKLFGNFPIIVYVYLGENKVKTYIPNQFYIDLLYNDIIPNMIQDIKNNKFLPTGLFKFNECKYCPYKDICYAELFNGGNNG